MAKKQMIYLAPVLAIAVSTLLISACSEGDNTAATQQVKERSVEMLDEVKEVVTESGSEVSQQVTDVLGEAKEKVQTKSKELTQSVKTAVVDVSETVTEQTAQTAAMVSAKVAEGDGADLYKSKGCAGCHATNAMGAIGPRLAGQQEEYLVDQFKLIRDGKRASGQAPMMSGAVKSVSDGEIAKIAGYLTSL